jgi:hypothetical protein
MIYIIAGNGRQADDWRRENKKTLAESVYVATVDVLHGVQCPIEVVRTGTWHERNDIKEIDEIIAYIGRT